jgi:hypothetical protein
MGTFSEAGAGQEAWRLVHAEAGRSYLVLFAPCETILCIQVRFQLTCSV